MRNNQNVTRRILWAAVLLVFSAAPTAGYAAQATPATQQSDDPATTAKPAAGEGEADAIPASIRPATRTREPRKRANSVGSHHTREFDLDKTAWEVKFANERHRKPQLLLHAMDHTDHLKGKGCERIRLGAVDNDRMAQLELPLPPSRVIDELQVKLWVKSNRRGPVLALRVVFPNQIDPRTGNRLRTIVPGDSVTRVDDWQLMKCKTTQQLLQSGLRRLRNQLRIGNLDTSGAYADKVLLRCNLSEGETDIRIDHLSFGPIVAAIPFKDDLREPEITIPVEFRLGRIFVKERPFFPRIVPYHGEPIRHLRAAGFNLVWVPDTDDKSVLQEIKDNDLWAMGTPSLNPKSVFHSASSSSSAGKAPDLTKLDSILCWYLGTQIGRSEHEKLVELSLATRAADRGVARPFAADVVNNERVYSRKIQMLGISRHMVGTEFSFDQFRQLISEKRKQALPGTFTWSWLQTEPVPAQVEWREQLGREQMVVEPEQIRLQMYSALAAGCRAIGFWKRGLLSNSTPGSLERRIQIAQLNLELDLLGDWLSAGEMDPSIPVEIIDPMAPSKQPVQPIQQAGRVGSGRRNAGPLSLLTGSGAPKREYSKELQAAAIRSSNGLLLLPVWYGKHAQFVPSDMSAAAIRMVVPGCEESAQPYAVTTTGVVPLPRKQVLGGLEITMKNFDQTAAIIITTRRDVMSKMTERAFKIAKISAELGVELVKAKMNRDAQVDSELRSLGCNPPNSESLLSEAQVQLNSASMLMNSGSYSPSLTTSRQAMVTLRRLQRAHWEFSLNGYSPMASPYTACFQTLPDHWRISNNVSMAFDPAVGGPNLVPLGNFERRDFIQGGGWTHEQNDDPRVRANAELWSDAIEGKLCLALIAIPQPQEDKPEFFDRSPVIVSSRGVEVQRGQVIRVSGKVRVKHPVEGSMDGAMVFDKVIGKAGALRWKQTRGWEEFAFLREIPSAGVYSVSFVLDGLGTFEVDDVKIQTIDGVGNSALALPNGSLDDGAMDMDRIPPALMPAGQGMPDSSRQVPIRNVGGSDFGEDAFKNRLRRAGGDGR